MHESVRRVVGRRDRRRNDGGNELGGWVVVQMNQREDALNQRRNVLQLRDRFVVLALQRQANKHSRKLSIRNIDRIISLKMKNFELKIFILKI